jgi:hypothetical protein
MKIQLAALVAVLAPLAVAQEEAPSRPSSPYIQLQYPRDKERAIAVVNGGEITLEDLARHIEERHRPGFRQFLATANGNEYFRGPVMATWVRQYADIVALHSEARSRNLDLQQAEVLLAESLKISFEEWLQLYVQQRNQEGNPVTLTQERTNSLLTFYQNNFGLESEFAGWLNFLVQDDATNREVRDFYSDHAKMFGGRINMAHILINTRDPLTGILLEGEAAKRANKKVADARSRLRDDGSNFEEVVRLLSDDRMTAKRGGAFHNVTRFDTRLPAILCRTAWQLRDGDVSEPVQTRFGTHIVKRISFQMNTFVLFTEQIVPRVRATMRQYRQEELLFDLRKRRRVELLY